MVTLTALSYWIIVCLRSIICVKSTPLRSIGYWRKKLLVPLRLFDYWRNAQYVVNLRNFEICLNTPLRSSVTGKNAQYIYIHSFEIYWLLGKC